MSQMLNPKKKSFWDNKVNYRIGFSMQKKQDADLLFRLAQEDNQSAFVRQALRWYVEHEDEIEEQKRQEAKKLAFPTANKTTTQ